MTVSFSVVLAALLAVVAFTMAGFSSWRAADEVRPLEPGPFWFWAWSALLLAALAGEYLDPQAQVLLSPLFPALQLAGAIRFTGRAPPVRALLLGAGALGGVRALTAALGYGGVGGGLTLAIEPAALLAAAWLVRRAVAAEDAHWAERLIPVALVAVAGAEATGALTGLLLEEAGILWPVWVALAVPLATLQVLARMDTQERSRREAEHARAARAAADERFRWLAAHTHDVVAEINAEGRIAWVGESIRGLFGAGAEVLVGRSADEVMRSYALERVEAPRAGSDWGGDEAARETRFQARDARGEKVWFDARLLAGAGFDESGARMVVARDVTAQVRAEEEIRLSEDRFRKFSLLGSDYCFIADGVLGGEVNNWLTGDLERISGYSHEELQEMGFQGFLHPDDIDAGRERVLELIRSGGESAHEFRLVTKSGETRWISERLLIERDGERFRIYGAARDISEQRQMERALGRAQKLESLGLLAGGIAHDFNNLLMAIAGNAELALDAIQPGSEATPYLEATVEAVDQAALLTQQLLAYAGRRGVTRGPVDLSERVRSVSGLLGTASGRSVDLQLSLDPALPAVLADPGGLQQLVMNLAINALEACSGEGHVRIATRPAGDLDRSGRRWLLGRYDPEVAYVALEVSDTGVGMSAETIERIFDPFFTTKTAGRGLGLAAAAGIVRSLGGGLQVESKSGEGTTFSVYLPASERAAPVKAAPLTRGPAAGRVLVVDDDARVRGVAASLLRSRGYQVEEAGDGRAAVRAFEAGCFDLVLLDAVMPGMSGAETFDALRAVRPDARVMMASGFDRESVVGDLLERGLADFIAKPFRGEDLATRIAALLE